MEVLDCMIERPILEPLSEDLKDKIANNQEGNLGCENR